MKPRTSGVVLGLVLAICNVIVISLGMGVAAGEGFVTVLVFSFTFIPAAFAGAVLGLLADVLATRHVILRFGVFGALAIIVLAELAHSFRFGEAVPYAAVPTFLAVVALERMTRRRVDPPIPLATVR